MKEKRLDIAHYFANAIVSDSAILSDESYLMALPDKIGISGRDREAFKGLVRAAVKAAAPLTEFSPEAFSRALQISRSSYAPDLRSAMVWATRNAEIMRHNLGRARPISPQGAVGDTSEDSALDVFLGQPYKFGSAIARLGDYALSDEK